MSPTRSLIDTVSIQVLKARIGVGLKSTLEGAEVPAGMLSLAVGRIGEPYGWRCLEASWTIVSDISPEAAGPGLAVAGREHGQWRVIGMQLGSGEHMLLDRIEQRAQQLARCADPASH